MLILVATRSLLRVVRGIGPMRLCLVDQIILLEAAWNPASKKIDLWEKVFSSLA